MKLIELEKLAPTNATILLTGETGTGKTHIAKLVHLKSGRRGEFVDVHCPNLSKELAVSELFGHAKGSFTGAFRDYDGKAAKASNGTLFLDEVADLNLEVQGQLLAFVETKKYQSLGSAVTKLSTARLICATNRDLRALVKEGKFREDLLFRLTTFEYPVAPLREQRDKIPVLVDTFIQEFNESHKLKIKGIDPEALAELRTRYWKGNVRELKSVIEKAVLLCDGETILKKDIATELVCPEEIKTVEGVFKHVENLITLAELEERYIQEVMRRCETKSEASRILGIDPATLYRKTLAKNHETQTEQTNS